MGIFSFIFILMVILSIALNKKEDGSNSTIRKFGKIVMYSITVIFLIVMLFPLVSQAFNLETNETVVADGFTIENYTVKLDVKDDLKVDVEEDIGINFYEAGHHGIYKFTPEWLKYTSKNGKTIRRKSEVSNLRAEKPMYKKESQINAAGFRTDYMDELNYSSTYEYTTDIVKKKPRIKIGSSSVTLDTGLKDYIIKYTYDMGSDPYEGYDEFIFHAYGDYWGTDIKNPVIEVTMPKSIEGNNVHFFMDKFRKCEVTDSVDYTVNGNKLVAKFNAEKAYKNSTGKCPKVLDKSLTVDIELPDNYFINGSHNYGNKSLTCIIICIIISIITFILWLIFGKDYEKKLKVVNYMPPRDLSAAEIGYVNSNNYSRKLVTSLIVELAAKKMITIKESKDHTILIKGQKPSKDDKDYEKKKEEYDKKVSKLNKYEQIVIKELIKGSEEIHLSEHQTFYTVFKEIENKLDSEYRWMINEKIGYVLKYLSLTLVWIGSILMFASYRYLEDLPQKLYNLYYVGFASVFITLFFSLIMTRKSRYGEDIKAEVSGFKEFLDKVEKDKLEELVEEMPDYFYQILPYTYVLNLSKKWIEKFENIKMPDVKYTSVYIDVLDRIPDQIYTPVASSSGSGCSSCSSCGGGCSSCGGGCSSCGGGGSW